MVVPGYHRLDLCAVFALQGNIVSREKRIRLIVTDSSPISPLTQSLRIVLYGVHAAASPVVALDPISA